TRRRPRRRLPLGQPDARADGPVDPRARRLRRRDRRAGGRRAPPPRGPGPRCLLRAGHRRRLRGDGGADEGVHAHARRRRAHRVPHRLADLRLRALRAAALFFLENALQSGPLVASQPAITLGDAGLSLALGLTLYAEYVRSGWWLVPQLLGVALIAGGVFALARLPQARVLAGEDRATVGAEPP